ncbi:alpha/beta hydrolase [Amycolatopsis acidicola]|uniref:Alpha/beta hydrolase n=1 Tax=Amycolatopsis acidicola TaxID=2596893 RepID=A0A5N0URK5_9PSEU|nr:alpha/beta hydrolase [Amycolatopsis acidicola]KAA9154291.1 alpha/beta hydrolase [Amycolatopsis acidicola]
MNPDEELRYGPDPDHVADSWVPARPRRPRLVLVHGGFWSPEYDRKHTRPMAAALRDAGWPVLAPEYRRRPGNPDAATEDLLRVLDSTGPGVLLVGHSAGGHLALWLAANRAGLLGTVALAPVADLVGAEAEGLDGGAVATFLGGPASERPDLDPLPLKDPEAPCVLLHGTRDSHVPIAQSRAYVAAHPAARLVELPGMGHFELIDPYSLAWPRVVAELVALAP